MKESKWTNESSWEEREKREKRETIPKSTAQLKPSYLRLSMFIRNSSIFREFTKKLYSATLCVCAISGNSKTRGHSYGKIGRI